MKIRPVVNQIKSNVGNWNDELIGHKYKNGIATIAWRPLGGIEDEGEKALSKIGEKYGKTAEQVVLRYQIEREVIVISKSHNKDRQAQSLDIFDFELTAEEHERFFGLLL